METGALRVAGGPGMAAGAVGNRGSGETETPREGERGDPGPDRDAATGAKEHARLRVCIGGTGASGVRHFGH